MIYLPPFVVHGTHLLTAEQLTEHARLYRLLLTKFTEETIPVDTVRHYEYLNEWLLQET